MDDSLEIGGYRELDLRNGYEYYKGDTDIARLNSGRAGIFYALRLLNCSKILIPYYECSTVKEFLMEQEIEVDFYHIDSSFRPILRSHIDKDTALLFVNYFGMIPECEEKKYVDRYKNVIFDHTQAFFSNPVEGGYSVYSPRKFFGVSDGCYVIGKQAERLTGEYEQDLSGDTCSFLLKRIETGGNHNYPAYCENEERINQSGIKRMSKITHALLDNIDYNAAKQKRKNNYQTAKRLFKDINLLSHQLFEKDHFAPMVYPLLVKDAGLRYFLKKHQIFVGQWWKYLINELPEDNFEVECAKFLIPIQIDHRYGQKEIIYTRKLIEGYLQNCGKEYT